MFFYSIGPEKLNPTRLIIPINMDTSIDATWTYHKDVILEGAEDSREIRANTKDGRTILCVGYSRRMTRDGVSVTASVDVDGKRTLSYKYILGENVSPDWASSLAMVLPPAMMHDVSNEDAGDFLHHALYKVW